MQDRRLLWTLGVTAGISWASWAYFLFFFNVGGIPSPWDPWRIVFYILLFLAPGLTFVPIGRWLKWRFFGLYAVLGWAAFGYLWAFGPPGSEGLPPEKHPLLRVMLGEESPLGLWYFFLALFIVLTTILAPPAYRLGLRLFTSRTHRQDIVRAWREAGLLSLYFVSMALIRSLGLFTWPIALLSLLFLALVEALFLAQKG